jgi:phospholipid-binding lipoprotein MlaA
MCNPNDFKYKISCLLISAALITGCASDEQEGSVEATAEAPVVTPAEPKPVVDPYESANRSIYDFNMSVDRMILKPVADGYRSVTPDYVQSRVSNFFSNLKGINNVLNDMLQGKFKQGMSDSGRFLTNTTVGGLGMYDVASDWGMPNSNEDFGQTLAVWGVDQGPYLMLPFLGPTTVRDGSMIVFDKAANPGTYVPGSGIIEGVSDRANAQGALNFIDEAALDPYVFTRESFLQYRASLVKDGKVEVEDYDAEIDSALADSGQATKSEKSKSSKATVVEPIKPTKSGDDVYKEMSVSFDHAEKEFQSADQKLDKIAKKRKK